MLTTEVPTTELFAFDTALIVTCDGDDIWAGAMYTPAEVIVPTCESPPVIPLTCQVTESSVVLATVAVKVCVPLPGGTLLDPGHTASNTVGVPTVHDG